MKTALYCCECESYFNANEIRFFCECGGLLDIKLHDGKLPPGFTKEELDRRAAAEIPGCASGVWRYRDMVLPDTGTEEIVSLHEGNTGLYDVPSAASWTGLDSLQVKHEGENPTGSFKDRGMTVAVTRAVQQGAKIVACASTGNTSASMASYAARAGLSSLVLIPEGKIAYGKLAQSLAYGAVTVEIKGDFDDGMKMIMESAKEGSLYPMNSVNPYRPEGQKTIIWEIFQQRKWDPPDWIVFPAGNLGNYSAFGKAVKQFYEFGLISKKTRLAGIQAIGANPFYQSYRTGFKEKFKVDAETLATAIRIGNPVNHTRAVRAVNWTNGIVAEVSDQEIMDAKNMMDRTGIGAEPSSNASIAGIKKLVRGKIIKPDESVTAILTGNILKDPDTVIKYHTDKLNDISSDNANRILSLKPDMKELGKLIDKLAKM
jgi:threonine synthase